MYFTSVILAANVSFFSYHTFLRNLKFVFKVPLSLFIYFYFLNRVVKNYIDRLYFPMRDIFKQIRPDKKVIDIKPVV